MNESSVTLHQQAGALTLKAFAEREGMTFGQVVRYAKSGWILGARKDARSKKWSIYPPAKLLKHPRKRGAPGVAASLDSLPCGSAVAVEAGAKSGRSSQYAPPVEAEGIRPPAGRVLEAASVFTSPERASDSIWQKLQAMSQHGRLP
ncbi:hypothetical protein [Candidatus Ferrigenium straubiae]|jgi:hypothetical protein|uniref:hypothetical protein n=1 Tax=Candidatus Ferrigenium straubiae TaxID=2919506 RepID=UPI003F4AD3C2